MRKLLDGIGYRVLRLVRTGIGGIRGPCSQDSEIAAGAAAAGQCVHTGKKKNPLYRRPHRCLCVGVLVGVGVGVGVGVICV